MEYFTFWHRNWSSNFQFVINKAIGHCSDFAANYLDDIIVFSRTAEDHMEHIEQVFSALQAADLKIRV